MTLEEIRAGIIRLLRSGTDVENITGEDVTQAKGFPLLHVQLTPLNYGGCGCRDVAGQADPCGHFLHGGAAHVK